MQPRLWVLALAAIFVVAPLPAAAERPHGSVIAWGCAFDDVGQCTVPAAAQSGVVAVAAADYDSLALTKDGAVLAWGCAFGDVGQCSVPPEASSGVVAISAGSP